MPFLLPNPIPQRHLQILEVPKETELEETCEIMGQTPDWLPGIELRADGFAAGFYRK